MHAEIITIGDEILIGQVVDTNSAWMGKALNNIGISVKQITSISDDSDHITAALNQARNRADIILITGGLGPTKDDITKITLAKYFNSPLVRDQETLKHVESLFARLNRPMIEMNMMQADVPANCKVIQNKNGTAPCMWFDVDEKLIISMPGVPFEMMYLMEDEIIPRLKDKFQLPHIIHQTILTVGQGESFLAQQIEDIEASLPEHIKLAYLPKLGQVRLRLSAQGDDQVKIEKEIAYFSELIIERVNEFVVIDQDIPLEKVILEKMAAHKLTLVTAESCTGGYIGHIITQHPGSSVVYLGGAVTYSNQLKQSILGVSKATLNTFGAVSEQTVTEMVNGAMQQFLGDYAIAVTGIAGPDGGTEEKPVGTVWVAVANKHNVVTKCFHFANKRTQNIERAATGAFTLLFRLLKQELD